MDRIIPWGEWVNIVQAVLLQRRTRKYASRLEPVWDSDSLDWKEIPADEITQRVVSRVCPGSIVLFHNAAIHTPEALPGIIQALLQEGYTFVPISQIILPGACGTDYTIDHTGRQQPCRS